MKLNVTTVSFRLYFGTGQKKNVYLKFQLNKFLEELSVLFEKSLFKKL
jgi:hypothetical protein